MTDVKRTQSMGKVGDQLESYYRDKLLKENFSEKKYKSKAPKKNQENLVFYRIVNCKTRFASTGGMNPRFVKTNGKFYQKKQLFQYLNSPGVLEMYQALPEYENLRIRKYIVSNSFNLKETEKGLNYFLKDNETTEIHEAMAISNEDELGRIQVSIN